MRIYRGSTVQPFPRFSATYNEFKTSSVRQFPFRTPGYIFTAQASEFKTCKWLYNGWKEELRIQQEYEIKNDEGSESVKNELVVRWNVVSDTRRNILYPRTGKWVFFSLFQNTCEKFFATGTMFILHSDQVYGTRTWHC